MLTTMRPGAFGFQSPGNPYGLASMLGGRRPDAVRRKVKGGEHYVIDPPSGVKNRKDRVIMPAWLASASQRGTHRHGLGLLFRGGC